MRLVKKGREERGGEQMSLVVDWMSCVKIFLWLLVIDSIVRIAR